MANRHGESIFRGAVLSNMLDRTMPSRLIRYLVTLVVLLTTPVAGLPLILCVSQAHGTAVEIDSSRFVKEAALGAKSHFGLFRTSTPSAGSSDCQDFRLLTGDLLGQSRHETDGCVVGPASGGKAPVATTSYELRVPSIQEANSKLAQRNSLILPSPLSDRRTIVLQI